MNIYYIIAVIVAVSILIGGIRRGWENGFAAECNVFVSLLLAFLTVRLLADITAGWREQNLSGIATGLVLAGLLAVFYRIYHMFFSMIALLTRLPLISTIDSFLGIVIGFAEGFIILYFLEYILRHYLL